MEDDDRRKKFGHYQDGHLTLLAQFPLPVLQGALRVTEICQFGNQHIQIGHTFGGIPGLALCRIFSPL
jgi:hypothetical protein